MGGRYLRTFISYDKGGEWSRLTAPRYDSHNNPTSCYAPNCYLNLASEFSSIYRTYQTEPILSANSTSGLIMATGSFGRNLYVRGSNGVRYRSRYLSGCAARLRVLPVRADRRDHLAANKHYHGHVKFINYSLDEGFSWQNFSEQSADLGHRN